jgi:hypothetical protein
MKIHNALAISSDLISSSAKQVLKSKTKYIKIKTSVHAIAKNRVFPEGVPLHKLYFNSTKEPFKSSATTQ